MTTTRYSKTSLLRTIQNRLIEARVDSVVHPWPKIQQFQREAVPLLEQVKRAVEAVDDLPKLAALKMLARMAVPGLPGGASGALAGIRTAVTSIGLDEEDDVVSIVQATERIYTLIEIAKDKDPIGLKRAEKRLIDLDKLSSSGVTEIRFKRFWDNPVSLG
jgi:hypothetical protein